MAPRDTAESMRSPYHPQGNVRDVAMSVEPREGVSHDGSLCSEGDPTGTSTAAAATYLSIAVFLRGQQCNAEACGELRICVMSSGGNTSE